MKHHPSYQYLVSNHLVMGGAPCIEGTRIRVVDVASKFAAGDSVSVISDDYDVDEAQVTEAIRAVCAAAFGQRGLFANVERELELSIPVQLT